MKSYVNESVKQLNLLPFLSSLHQANCVWFQTRSFFTSLVENMQN